MPELVGHECGATLLASLTRKIEHTTLRAFEIVIAVAALTTGKHQGQPRQELHAYLDVLVGFET